MPTTIDWTLLEEQLCDETEAAPSDAPGGWIANGSERDPDTSPAAQGRRAAHCAERIRQAREIRQMQEGSIGYRITDLERKLAAEKHALQQLDNWEAERTRWHRMALASWYRESDTLQHARPKTIPLGENLKLGSRHVNPPARIDWADADAALGLLPDECWERKFSKAAAKAFVEARGAAVVVKATGEVLPPEVATAHRDPERDTVFVQVGATKIDLTAESDEDEKPGEAPADDTTGDTEQPDPAPEFDPFGDDEEVHTDGC